MTWQAISGRPSAAAAAVEAAAAAAAGGSGGSDATPCMVCGKTDGEESFVLCDGCEEGGGRAWQILLATS